MEGLTAGEKRDYLMKGTKDAGNSCMDSETIDKIAAGEVVERPSSVVKELVENAIDAGATAITVEAKDGGISMIRVTDNGCGMAPDQVRNAFLRHATSKIRRAEDLANILSLGFRGEALSSIAAVSQVEMVTKTPENLTGVRIRIEGGAESSFEEVGAPEGTTFIMRNLFFNTPVRRKFLKTPSTEGGYITDLMEHLALSRPDVSFQLMIGGQTRFHTSGNGDLKEVIYRIYGREIAGVMVPIQFEKRGMKVEGYLGKPVLVRANRNFEIYYVNGRFIRSNVIARSLEEGYKGYLMQHKFPFCVLHLSMDPQLVDVNVHPTKMDVRLGDNFSFSEFLTEAVQNTLKEQEMIPDARLDTAKEQKEQARLERQDRENGRAPEPFETNRRAEHLVREETVYSADSRKTRDSFAQNPVWARVKGIGKDQEEETVPAASTKTETTAREDVGAAGDSVARTDSGVAGDFFTKGSDGASERDAFPAEEDTFFTETSELDGEESAKENSEGDRVEPEKSERETFGRDNSGRKDFGNGYFAERESDDPLTEGVSSEVSDRKVEPPRQLNLFEEKILTTDHRSRFRIIGQVFETYWLVQYEDKLLMIDQHAAHEKVNYERLMKQFHEKNVVAQMLMPPVIVSLTGREETTLREHLEIFAELGFEVEAFGGNEYALRSVPADLYGCGEKEMFLETLDQLGEGVSFGGVRVIEEKIASMSCKAAVKGNRPLSFPEAETLIDELLTLENPYNCPHGRPTIVSMTKYEMDRKFKRIVD